MSTASSAVLLHAIEETWRVIRDRHEDVPAVIVTMASGTAGRSAGVKLGHFAKARWASREGGGELHELFIGGEGLREGAVDVLGTLLHEAAHGVAATRGLQDTSRQGRYHSKAFKQLTAELGLSVTYSSQRGFSDSTVPEATQQEYAAELAALDKAMTTYRRVDPPRPKTGKTSSNGLVLVCECPRKIRASKAVAQAGPITCGICDTDFVAQDNDE